MESSYTLGGYRCFQCYETGVALCKRTSQLGIFSQKSPIQCGLFLGGLNRDKAKPKVFDLDLSHCRQRRGSGTSQFSYRNADNLSVCYNSVDNDRASTESTQQQHQNVEPADKPEVAEQEVTVSGGLHALDRYFNKLRGGTGSSKSPVHAPNSNSVSTVVLPLSEQHRKRTGSGNHTSATVDSGREGREQEGLKALDAYFEKLNPRKPESKTVQETEQPETEIETEEELPPTDEEVFMKTLMEAKEEYEKYRSLGGDNGSSQQPDLKFQMTSRVPFENDMELSSYVDPEEQGFSSSTLINFLVATNIAVYLFGLASPLEALGITDSSLPFVYGAKVNDLILAGQWWRFITPMFLHASLLHVGLGSWALLSFGPAVASAYGTLGFAMIYFLGGLFGDLSSFYHTTESTVGGTGPIYALVGTWVIYLLKNREIIGKDVADDMVRKVVILSALNVALCNSLPIDDWTHLGATLIGTWFGMLTSPTMQLNVTLKEVAKDQEEEDAAAFVWFNDGASPARLIAVFSLCLGIFFTLYQFSISGYADNYLLQDIDIFS